MMNYLPSQYQQHTIMNQHQSTLNKNAADKKLIKLDKYGLLLFEGKYKFSWELIGFIIIVLILLLYCTKFLQFKNNNNNDNLTNLKTPYQKYMTKWTKILNTINE